MSSRREVLKSLALSSLSLPWIHTWAGTVTLPDASDPDYWEKIRDAFMLSKDKVFFNTGTVGAMPKVVVQRVFEHFEKLATDIADWDYKTDIGWISGYHPLPDLRQKIARLIHADPRSVALTDNVTTAMSYIAMGLNLKAGDEVLSIVRKSIRPETRVLMLSHIITGSGAVLPVKEICAEARSKGIITVLDGAQAIGQINVDVADIGCDAYVGCFHKWIGAPPGTGFMWVKPELLKTLWTTVSSYQWDNHEDEGFRFSQRGTGNYSILIGLDAALDFHQAIGPQRVYDRIKYLGSYLRDGLRKIPRIKIFSPADEKMCAGITVYNVAGMTGAQLQDAFWNRARMRPRSQGDEFGVRQCTHIYHNLQELDKTLEIIKAI